MKLKQQQLTFRQTSKLSKAHEMHDSLAVPVHRLSLFCCNSLLKSALQPQIAK